MLKLPKSQLLPNKIIQISGSKSESNRLLILQKLLGYFEIENLSDSQDTHLLQKALTSNEKIIDIHHAGTAMRFLTSYFAIQEGKITILTGSERMKERPIRPLVNALKDLGAKIEYLENEGFPPLKIYGKKLTKNYIEIPADISSQFISSLLLISPMLENGIEIKLIGKITSKPYLEMTLKLLSNVAQNLLEINFSESTISIKPKKSNQENGTIHKFTIESDWSSVSYFYSLSAIGRKTIIIKNFKENSLQGDAIISEIYQHFFGIKTIFNPNNQNKIEISPINNFCFPKNINICMNNCPDIAQTICVTASALKIHFKITGLETLKIKETDRLVALQNELLKVGVKTKITENSIESLEFFEVNSPIKITTYDDHRMAMCFAPFALIQELEIQNPKVVEKSYPNFWNDFKYITQKLNYNE